MVAPYHLAVAARKYYTYYLVLFVSKLKVSSLSLWPAHLRSLTTTALIQKSGSNIWCFQLSWRRLLVTFKSQLQGLVEHTMNSLSSH